MQTGVDVVNIVQIPELAPAAGVDLTWVMPISNPAASGQPSKKYTLMDTATLISEQIGSVTVPDPTFYTPTTGQYIVNDTDLAGLDYTLYKWGVGPLRKGTDWQNDVVGGGFRLISLPATTGEMYVVIPKPQISNILAAPGAIGRFTDGIAFFAADGTIGAADYRKLIVINGAKNLMLPLCSSYPTNVALFITTSDGPQKQSTLNTQGGDLIYSNGGSLTAIYIGNREFVTFITDGTSWYIQDCSPAIFATPTKTSGWFVGLNQLPLTGGVYNRADYPRVWAFIQQLAALSPSVVVSAAAWVTNRTLWGYGNGTTTFQVPDIGGYFDRNLDVGNSGSVNVDPDRRASGLYNKSGSAQAFQVQSHSHTATFEEGNDFLTGTGWVASSSGAGLGPDQTLHSHISSTGGSETRGVNVGFYPLINI